MAVQPTEPPQHCNEGVYSNESMLVSWEILVTFIDDLVDAAHEGKGIEENLKRWIRCWPALKEDKL